MHRFFTNYWIYKTARSNPMGEPLNHAAGTFTSRGIRCGDIVYVLTGNCGELFLMGKMEVGAIVDTDDVARRILRFEPWSAKEHLIAKACTPIQLEPVPKGIVKSLRFVSRAGNVTLKFGEQDDLDLQSIRGVRELEAESAALLDATLPKLTPWDPGPHEG